MRQVVLAHQNLLNPSRPKGPHQPAPATLEMARELLKIGAERGLKILFCEAVDALNASGAVRGHLCRRSPQNGRPRKSWTCWNGILTGSAPSSAAAE